MDIRQLIEIGRTGIVPEEEDEYGNGLYPEKSEPTMQDLVMLGRSRRSAPKPLDVSQYPDRSLLGEVAAGISVGLGDILPMSVAQSIRDGDINTGEPTALDRYINRQKAEAAETLPSRQQMEGSELHRSLFTGPQSTAYSLALGLGGMAAIGAAGSLVGPGGTVAGAVAGALGAGGATYLGMYRTAKDDFVDQIFSAGGKNMSASEWNALKDEIDGAAQAYGHAEAGPEAFANALESTVFRFAGKLIPMKFIKNAGLRTLALASGKIATTAGTELATETYTQKKQTDILSDYMPGVQPQTYGEAFKEIAGPTLVGTALIGGGGHAVSRGLDLLDQRRIDKRINSLIPAEDETPEVETTPAEPELPSDLSTPEARQQYIDAMYGQQPVTDPRFPVKKQPIDLLKGPSPTPLQLNNQRYMDDIAQVEEAAPAPYWKPEFMGRPGPPVDPGGGPGLGEGLQTSGPQLALPERTYDAPPENITPPAAYGVGGEDLKRIPDNRLKRLARSLKGRPGGEETALRIENELNARKVRGGFKAPKPVTGARTLGGELSKYGGLSFKNMPGELKNMPDSVKKMSRRKGMPLDQAETSLREAGYLQEGENLLGLLRDNPVETLRRSPLGTDVTGKLDRERTPKEQRLIDEALNYEPESPPEGDYADMPVEDIPDGAKVTAILPDGTWGTFTNKEGDFKNTLVEDNLEGKEVELPWGSKLSVLTPKEVEAKPVETETPIAGTETPGEEFDPLAMLLAEPTAEAELEIKQRENASANLDAMAKEADEEAETWEAKKYKSNNSVVSTGGTAGGFNSGSTTIGAANARRKANRIRDAKQRAVMLREAKQMLSRGKSLESVMEFIDNSPFIVDKEALLRKAEPKPVKPVGSKSVEPAKPKPVEPAESKPVEPVEPVESKPTEPAEEEAAEAARKELENRSITYFGKARTFKDYVASLIDEGYLLEESKRGFATVVVLKKGNESHHFKTKEEVDYVREKYNAKLEPQSKRQKRKAEAAKAKEVEAAKVKEAEVPAIVGSVKLPEVVDGFQEEFLKTLYEMVDRAKANARTKFTPQEKMELQGLDKYTMEEIEAKEKNLLYISEGDTQTINDFISTVEKTMIAFAASKKMKAGPIITFFGKAKQQALKGVTVHDPLTDVSNQTKGLIIPERNFEKFVSGIKDPVFSHIGNSKDGENIYNVFGGGYSGSTRTKSQIIKEFGIDPDPYRPDLNSLGFDEAVIDNLKIKDVNAVGGDEVRAAILKSRKMDKPVPAEVLKDYPDLDLKKIAPTEPKFQAGQGRESKRGILERVVARVEKEWKNKPFGGFKIVEDISEFPDFLKARAEDKASKTGGVRAVYWPPTGEVWLVRSAIGNEVDVMRAILHESVGHFGVRRVLSRDDADLFFDNIWETKNEEALSVAQKAGIDTSTLDGKRLAAEEWFAEHVESGARDTTWSKFVRIFHRFLRSMGINTRFGDSDIAEIVGRSRAYVIDGKESAVKSKGGWGPTQIPMNQVLASRWYSQMEKILDAKLPGKGTGASMLEIVSQMSGPVTELTDRIGELEKKAAKLKKKGGSLSAEEMSELKKTRKAAGKYGAQFKREELEWSGLAEWLEAQDGKVTKAQVMDWLAENNTRVEEVVKGKQDRYPDAMFDRYSELAERGYDELSEDERQEYEQLHGSLNDSGIDNSKYSKYQIPGGKDYKELLITLPEKRRPSIKRITMQDLIEKDPVLAEDFVEDISDRRLSDDELDTELNNVFYPAGRDQVSQDVAQKIKSLFPEIVESNVKAHEALGQVYRGSHWDEPNVLAHVRLNERVVNGKRTLFVEEVQSDWHQKGRDEGYKKPRASAEEQTRLRRAYESIGSRHMMAKAARKTEQAAAMESEMEAAHTAYIDSLGDPRGVPNAPFRKSWPLLAMKRMIRYAAENGFDQIAWTPGSVQADRYDLGKQVDTIEWSRQNNLDGSPGRYTIVLKSQNAEIDGYHKKDMSMQDVEELVGKDIANKILLSEKKFNDFGQFEGRGLKVGGEGMKAFYDMMLPAAVDKFVKKWGAKTSTTDVDGVQAHMIEVTEPMRLAALNEGMPLFTTVGRSAQKMDSESLDRAKEMRDANAPREEIYSDGAPMFSVITDKDLVKRLESGKKIKAFRAMQIVDGKLYPPMSAKINKEFRDPTEIGQWEQADERPDLAKDGKFKLSKGNNKSIWARYNPYFHSSPSPLNDQFSSAHNRDNLVTVEVEIPESELTSGYKAQGAKDSVGEKAWHAGPVSSKLPKGKKRTVFLSRYAKVVRVVPDSEVAERVAKLIEGENLSIPEKVITPSLKRELLKLGVAIDELEAPRGLYSSTQKTSDTTPLFATRAAETTADPYAGLSEEAKNQMIGSKRIKGTTLLESARDVAKKALHSFTRSYIDLDPKTEGHFADQIRIFTAVSGNSRRRAKNAITAILEGLTPKRYEVFSSFIIARDMIKDIEKGVLSPANGLPFGIKDEKMARGWLTNLQKMVNADPTIREALDRREKYMGDIRKDLVNLGLLNKEALGDSRYFHHQVLEYRAAKDMGQKYRGGSGTGAVDMHVKRKGYEIMRKGSLKNYNTDYVQSEIEVMGQALAQVETRKILNRLREMADVRSDSARKASRNNKAAFEAIIEGMEEDPTGSYRSKIAYSNKKLGELAAAGALEYDAKYAGLVRELARNHMSIAGEHYGTSDPRWWEFLNHLLENKYTGSAQAATIFKAIAERNRLMKETLGDKYETWQDHIPRGYVVWSAKKNGTWFRTHSITDQMLEKITTGVEAFSPDRVTDVMARAQGEVWVIPEGLAKTMDSVNNVVDEGILGDASAGMISMWKKWTLINPYRIVKYNMNNFSGDMDIVMAAYPEIISKYLWNSVKDLRTVRKGKPVANDVWSQMEDAHRLAAIDSGWTYTEIESVNQALSFDKHMQVLMGEKPNIAAKFWRKSQDFTNYRENWLRLASYRFFLDQIEAGKRPGTDLNGASKRAELQKMVEAGATNKELAAKLSRELIGDYGNISQAGQWLRKHLIPFYSWMEINAPRYYRLMSNLPYEGGSVSKLSSAMAWRTSVFGVKAAAMAGAVMLWNATMYPDEDDELSDMEGRQLHLILGRREDGTIMSLRMQGALSDAISWFGAEDLVRDIREVKAGRASVEGKLKEAALAPVGKLINASRPIIKTAGETLTGKSLYPDPFHPKPIRDQVEHIARLFSLSDPYKIAAGKPRKGADVDEQLFNDILNLGLYSSDPGETAYFNVKAKLFDFMREKGVNQPSLSPTEKSNSLYYYRQALRYGDLKAAKKYLAKYMELDGNWKGLRRSIKMSAPLGGLPRQYRRAFFETLAPEDKAQLERATNWYKLVYLQRR